MNIKKYISKKGDIVLKELLKIGEIKGLELIGGQITARIEAKDKNNAIGTVKVIVPKAIKGGKILHEELNELDYKVELDEKRLTRKGDIVLKMPSPYDAAVITEEDEGLLIPSFCIIIRNTDLSMDSDYLAAFFNSNVYLEQVKAMVSGAAMPMLTIGKIKDVVVRSVALEDQKQIAEYYRNISLKEEILARVIALEKEKLDCVLRGERDE